MDWVLFIVVSLGWVIGFILLGRLYNWALLRMEWTFHTLTENSYLKMNEGAQDRFYWEDEDERRRQ